MLRALQRCLSGKRQLYLLCVLYRIAVFCINKSLTSNFRLNIYVFVFLSLCSKNNRSIDTPVKGPPQGPRLHIDIPRVQLLIEDKEGIKQIGM